MAKLVLHIGTAKTGTKFIQTFLAENRHSLLRQNILVPHFLGAGINHRWLVFLAQDPDQVDAFSAGQGLGECSERRSRRRMEKLAELKQQVALHSATTWIISSEHMQSRLRDGEIRRLKDLLDPLFETIQILIYLRHPLHTAVSSWSTMVKNGNGTPRLQAPEKFAHLCAHQQILERWLEVFPRDQFSVRLFQDEDFFGGDLLQDFCHAAGIELEPTLLIPERQNTALSHLTIKVLERLKVMASSRLGDRHSPLFSQRWGEIVRLASQHLSAFPTYVASESEAALYADYYRDSEQWVQQTFFRHKSALWDRGVPQSRDDADPRFQPQLSPEEEAILAMAVDLWLSAIPSDPIPDPPPL
jgi:hypothetical protein